MGSIPTLVRVFLCPCVGPFPSVGLTLTWFIWERNLALQVTLHSIQWQNKTFNLGKNSLGKRGTLICLSLRLNSSYFPPPPTFQCWLKKRPKACTVFCIIITTLVWAGGSQEFCPRLQVFGGGGGVGGKATMETTVL